MQAVIIVGIPGAGKSTIIDRVTKDEDGKYKFVNIGSMMLELGVKRGYFKHRDEIRYQTNDERQELIREAFKEIAMMDGNIIIDTHASIGEHGRYMPGLPGDVVVGIKGLLRALITFDAPTADILSRRQKDKERRREVETADAIEMQKIINISALSALSQKYNVPLFVLFNEENKQDASEKTLRKYLEYIFNEDKMKRLE